jgi:1A family penicillin-binding protein
MPKKKHRNKRHFWLKTIFAIIVALGLFVSGAFLLWLSTLKIPDLTSFDERKISQSTKIYDRTGEVLLFDVHQYTKRTVIPFVDMSRNIKNATVAIEDAEFYQHKGIKPKSILRAVFSNLSEGRIYGQGGSTITQQVVKNSILTSEKKISRKLKEWVLALKLEKAMRKEDILELYLNETPYGGNIYGVEEASQSFFGKSASELTIAESAYLAALPQAPTYYSPYGNHRDQLEKRKNLVLEKMLENKFISEDEYQKALKENVSFQPQTDVGIRAPHFVMFIKEYLEKNYGVDSVTDGGLTVITTLDYKLQKQAEEIVRRFAEENESKFNATNAAMVAIDPQTGQILIMVGSRDYFNKDIGGNFNVTIAHRQPGSAFKPFVYATAFKKGYTPETVVFDLETEFSTECTPEGKPNSAGAECYKPSNYDNVFRGPVTFREALAQSINVPAIKVLYLAGLRDSLKTAKDMGIESLADIDRYGLTLVLGGGEVSLLDMTSAYGVFANNGLRNPYTGILKVEDAQGNILESFRPHPRKVLDEKIALQISDILSDNKARAPAFGEHSYLYFPGRDVAVKTGTTNDYRDAWIIGYTPEIAVGAWAGNNDNSPMEKKVAGFIVAPMWNAFMSKVLKNISGHEFKKPSPPDTTNYKPILRGIWEGGVTYTIDAITGKLATEYTPPELRKEKVVKNIHSILYWVDKNDPLGPKPEHPEENQQFILWEYAVRKWVKQNNITEEDMEVIPTDTDDVHLPNLAPKIIGHGIIAGNTYKKNQKIIISITSEGRFPLLKADLFINGLYVASTDKKPFRFSFIPAVLDNIKTSNTLKIIGYDSVLNRGEYTTKFLVEAGDNQ